MRDLDLIIIRVCRMYGSSVMVGMCPPKCLGFIEAKETKYFIEKRVYTAGLKHCPMTEFVPAWITKGINRSIDKKRRDCPPGAPREKCQIPGCTECNKVHGNMNPGIPIPAPGQLF